MQPIATSIAPLPAPAGADAIESSPESADGFAALLAGLVPPPVTSPPSHSGNQPLVLSAGSSSGTNEPDEDDIALSAKSIGAPNTTPILAIPPAAGGSSTAANALGATSPDSFGASNNPSAKPGDSVSTPTDAADSALATGISKAQATGDVRMAPVVAQRDVRPADPQPIAKRAASAAATARLDQLASDNRTPPATAVAQASEAMVQTTRVTALATTPSFAMTVAPDNLGQSEWQPTFNSDQADGSLLRGLTAPTAIGGDAAAAGPSEAPAGAAMQPMRQLAAVIDRAVAGEVRQLTIQLSPQELGAIDIALSFDKKRRLSVSILAERPETLELLKNDARQLERLLGRQGIELADAGLELGLMSQERRGDGNAHESAGQHVLAAFGERAGANEPSAGGPTVAVPTAAVGTLDGARRLNLSI